MNGKSFLNITKILHNHATSDPPIRDFADYPILKITLGLILITELVYQNSTCKIVVFKMKTVSSGSVKMID